MSSFNYAFLKSGLYRDDTQITAAKSIGRNWQHVYILRFWEALGCPYERLVRYKCLVHKTRLCKIRVKATEQLCLNKIGKYKMHVFRP